MRKIVFPLLLSLPFFGVIACNRQKTTVSAESSAPKVLYYVDPMHPAYKSDKPGIAPDCGMQLEPVYAESSTSAAATASASLSAQQQQLIGLRVSTVEATPANYKVRLLGRVAVDETRLFKVNAGIDGFIQSVSSATTGSMVSKDQLLGTFAAPNANMTIQTFLLNLGAEDRFAKAMAESSAEAQSMASTSANIQQRNQQLLNIGMSPLQMQEIRKSRMVPDSIKIVSPINGIVLSRNIAPGQKFERGAEWFQIADLTHVWILANVIGKDAEYLQPGVAAQVSIPNQNRTFTAYVSEVLPQVDAATGALKVRLSAKNMDNVLRPDMFVDVLVPVKQRAGITVPNDAVIDSGMRKSVFVERGEGKFEAREVLTGAHFDDRVQIVKGLSPGDRIVVSGNFLLDSETRLRNPSATPAPIAEASMKMAAAPSAPKKAKSAAPEMNVAKAEHVHDPKCGMEIEAAQSQKQGLTTEYKGATYYFCSKGCKDGFLKDPEKYLAARHMDATHHD